MSVKDLVLEMRRYRMGLIQTAEQLRFSYQSIIEGAETLGIDLRSPVYPSSYNNGDTGNPSESDDDDDSDDSDDVTDSSDSAEEVDEEDDVGSVDSPFHSHINHFPVGEVVVACVDASNDGPEEPPPPIPPRGESLATSPGKFLSFALILDEDLIRLPHVWQITTDPCRWCHNGPNGPTKKWSHPQ